MATTLQTYLTAVQRLLHDPNGQFWPISELTDYINEARNRAAADSKALRQIVPGIVLTPQVESYSVQNTLAAALGAYTPIDVMGIAVYWGNTRYKLGYKSFTELDALGRTWTNNYGRPEIFSRMGALTVFVNPSPDQAYVTDWDVAVLPPALVLSSDSEVIPSPFTGPIKYYAASVAKFKEQQLGESKIFEQKYTSEIMRACRVFMQRVIPNPYVR